MKSKPLNSSNAFFGILFLLFSFNVFSQTTIYSEDFNSGFGGWTIASTGSGTGTWINGSNAAHSTGATGNYVYSQLYSGNYNNNTYIVATSPTIDMTGYSNISFDFDIWYNTESGWDGMKVEYSLDNGGSWNDLGSVANTNWYNDTDVDAFNNNEDGWSNNSFGWVTRSINLSAEDAGFDNNSQVKIRVLFATDNSITDVGVAFDTILIQGLLATPMSCSPVVITLPYTQDFEIDTDNWTSGGADAFWATDATWSYSGSHSLLIRSGSGDTSAFCSPLFNLSTYDKVDFKFFFSADSMDSAYDTSSPPQKTSFESFHVEYSDDDGATWTIVNTYESGQIAEKSADFETTNSTIFYSKTATLLKTNYTFPNSNISRFRVRCDASANDDIIYIDDIKITGVIYSTPTIAPGGVTSNLDLWLKADYVDGSTIGADGSNVSKWVDNGKGNDAEVVIAGQEPVYRNSVARNINFNPVVDFENDNTTAVKDMTYLIARDELKGTGGFNSNDIFIVIIPDPTITTGMWPLDTFTSTDPTGRTYQEDVTGFGYGGYTARFNNEYFTYCIGTTSGLNNGYGRADKSGTTNLNQVSIMNTRHDTSNSGIEIYLNANKIGTDTSDAADFSTINNTRFWLGRSQLWSGSFDGRIAEVITYSSRKTDATERKQIESYLAIKYGITLGLNGTSQDYVDSDGTIIWDIDTGVPANDVFNYDITGIGRDDASELTQKQSKSVNSLAAPATADDITIGLTNIAATNSANANTFGTNKTFLVWGNNNGNLNASAATTVDMSSGIASLTTEVQFQSFNRKWKLVENGTVGKVKISIPSTMLIPTLPAPGDYLMFISDSPTFTPTSEYRVMTVNGTNFETSYDFPSNGTKYITFGYSPEETFVRSIKFTGSTAAGGTNDYLDAGDVLDLNTTAFTISAWIKRENTSASIISKRDAAYSNGGYDFSINGSGNLEMSWKNGTTQTITSSIAIPVSKWHHVAVIYDGTAKLYIDGVEDTTQTTALSAPITNTESFLIAAAGESSTTAFFIGNIDEVRIWNVALTEDQLRFVINQEIEDNTTVDGSYFAGLSITPTKNDISAVNWTDLAGYYPMSTYTYTNCKDASGNGNTAALINLRTVDHQTAPLPYVSTADGPWDTAATWLNNTVQDLPNSFSIIDGTTPINWNIVEINNNVTIKTNTTLGREREVLALMVNSNKLTVNGTTNMVDGTATGNGITVTHYVGLNGKIDLEGGSQLVQTSQSDLVTNATGELERDQQGTASSYNYNYWSSSVGVKQASPLNTNYTISQVLKDGRTSTPADITFNTNYAAADGATIPTPMIISSYWLRTFNGTSDDYNSWSAPLDPNATNLSAGEGFTMKGVVGTAAITDYTNFTFVGRPNNGDFILPIIAGNDRLIGNPYPSAIDANEFILDNINDGAGRNAVNVFNGALYFWHHFAKTTHNLADYVGGYATYTLMGGAEAVSNDIRINNNNAAGSRIPERYIPVNQGFFVFASLDAALAGTTATVSGGNIEFKNSQRVFELERVTGTNSGSLFFKSNSKKKQEQAQKNKIDQRKKIRLMFDSPKGYHRQLLVGIDENASDAFDLGYDGLLPDLGKEDMYWDFSGGKFVIQAVNDFNKEKELLLGLQIEEDGLIKIAIDTLENIPEDFPIFIKDKLTGETYNITNQAFEINLEAGKYVDRFVLAFEPRLKTLEEIALFEGISIYMNNTSSEIQLNRIIDAEVLNVTLFNYLGQQIRSWNTNLTERIVTLPIQITTGAYIVKVTTNVGVITKKIIIE